MNEATITSTRKADGEDPATVAAELRKTADLIDVLLDLDMTVTVSGTVNVMAKFKVTEVPCDDCGRTDGTHDPEVEH